MNGTSQLRLLYEQWGALTEEEGQAIQAANWGRVEACQSRKLRLQTRIRHVTTGFLSDAQSPGADRTATDGELRSLVEELITRERRNSQALTAQRQRAQAREAELLLASRQLKQVHRAYAPGSPPLWHSYS